VSPAAMALASHKRVRTIEGEFQHRKWLMKGKVSVLLDAAMCISFIALIYTLSGGEVQWENQSFKFTLKHFTDHLQILILTLIIKVIYDLNHGIFAYFSKSNVRIISYTSEKINRFHKFLHYFYITNKLNLLILIISFMISLGFLEIYFRYFPHTLPQALGNYIASGYNDYWLGIYKYHPEIKMFLMRPHYERQMYFNGYYWHHKTDAMGFRNPTDRLQAYVVLLGDSMVYGHGVEEPSTIRHYLEILLKQSVANLGIQGGSIHQEYQILKTYGISLKPKYVFVFFLVNDIHDLTVYLSASIMASATPGDSVRGYSTVAPEARSVRGRRCASAWPHVADAVIKAYLSDEEIYTFLNTSSDDHTTPYIHAKKVKEKFWGKLNSYTRDFYIVKAYKFLKNILKINSFLNLMLLP
jgi:hypothetical protein